MNHLKLIIKNSNLATKKENDFFDKSELKIIFNLYAKMVSKGYWKDYGLNISKKEVSFNIYKRTSEFPVYKITKNLNPKNKKERFIVKDIHFNTIKTSQNLESLIQNVKWKGFKLVN